MLCAVYITAKLRTHAAVVVYALMQMVALTITVSIADSKLDSTLVAHSATSLENYLDGWVQIPWLFNL